MADTTTHPIDLDALEADFRRDGYVVVSGLLDDTELDALEAALTALQIAVGDGTIDRSRYGGDYLTAAAPGETAPFVHYVKDVTRLSPEAYDAFHHPVLLELLQRCFDGAEPWEFDESLGARFGVVYQDARPGQGDGLHPHRVALGPPGVPQLRLVPVDRPDVPRRRHVAGQRVPARRAGEPPVARPTTCRSASRRSAARSPSTATAAT